MDFLTVGREHHNDYILPIGCSNISELFKEKLPIDRFRLVLISKGSGVLSINGNKFAFIAPKVFCLNENEVPIIHYTSELDGLIVHFHPSAINDKFDFCNIRAKSADFTNSDLNDQFYISPFFHRDDNHYGQVDIGPAVFQRINFLINNLDNELNIQRDIFWPCRSRSYLLEILFLIEQVRSNDLLDITFELKTDNNIIENVILYLQNNYNKKISITDLTNTFNINRTTLSEEFLRVTGMTIISYLTNLRIHIASLILRDTRIPVFEVSERVGFNDIHHFGRVFKKCIGASPNTYRQKYCNIA